MKDCCLSVVQRFSEHAALLAHIRYVIYQIQARTISCSGSALRFCCNPCGTWQSGCFAIRFRPSARENT